MFRTLISNIFVMGHRLEFTKYFQFASSIKLAKDIYWSIFSSISSWMGQFTFGSLKVNWSCKGHLAIVRENAFLLHNMFYLYSQESDIGISMNGEISRHDKGAIKWLWQRKNYKKLKFHNVICVHWIEIIM